MSDSFEEQVAPGANEAPDLSRTPSAITIRHADPVRDAAACLEIYTPHVVGSATSFEDEAPSLSAFEQRIERISRTHSFLVAQTDSDRIAGYVYAGAHRDRPAYRWACEVAVYLHQDFQGRGLGKALYQPLLRLLELQGYRTALAGITVGNAASLALHRSLGFEEVGVYRRIGWKDGSWRDVAWLSKQLGPDTFETQSPPSPRAPVRLDAPLTLRL